MFNKECKSIQHPKMLDEMLDLHIAPSQTGLCVLWVNSFTAYLYSRRITSFPAHYQKIYLRVVISFITVIFIST